jgi:hypothetical protein
MKTNKFGELIRNEQDLADLVMQGHDIWRMPGITVEDIDIERMAQFLDDPGAVLTWTFPDNSDVAVPDWDHVRQQQWFMPDSYRELDIAQHVLDRCTTDAELQRVGQELLMFQERDLFNLLRYMKYLVDVMREHNVIWGIGRGSSVASYVLYLLGVHRVDSLYYDLDPREFLR